MKNLIILVLLLLCCAPVTASEQLIMAHRGASGYLPEHTLAAKADEINGNGHNGNGKAKVQDYGLVKNTAGQCPECATLLVYQEGCFVCPGCGYTKC